MAAAVPSCNLSSVSDSQWSLQLQRWIGKWEQAPCGLMSRSSLRFAQWIHQDPPEATGPIPRQNPRGPPLASGPGRSRTTTFFFFPRVRTPCGHGAQVIVEGREEQSDGGEKTGQHSGLDHQKGQCHHCSAATDGHSPLCRLAAGPCQCRSKTLGRRVAT